MTLRNKCAELGFSTTRRQVMKAVRIKTDRNNNFLIELDISSLLRVQNLNLKCVSIGATFDENKNDSRRRIHLLDETMCTRKFHTGVFTNYSLMTRAITK